MRKETLLVLQFKYSSIIKITFLGIILKLETLEVIIFAKNLNSLCEPKLLMFINPFFIPWQLQLSVVLCCFVSLSPFLIFKKWTKLDGRMNLRWQEFILFSASSQNKDSGGIQCVYIVTSRST